MGKVKKFTAFNIRKLVGGKDPVRMVEEFLSRLDLDPDDAKKDKTADHARWMVTVGEGDDANELEILVENIRSAQEATVYMGINLFAVPLRGMNETLLVALEIADGLVGTKVSLVGHYLVLSATLGASGMTIDELDYHYRLILAQKDWFVAALADELPLFIEGE